MVIPVENISEKIVETAALSTGPEIKRLREEQAWSQRHLAERVSVFLDSPWRQTTVAKVESSARPLRWSEALALSIVFKRPPDELLGAESYDEVVELRKQVALADWEAFKEGMMTALGRIDPRIPRQFTEEMDRLIEEGEFSPELAGLDTRALLKSVMDNYGQHPEET